MGKKVEKKNNNTKMIIIIILVLVVGISIGKYLFEVVNTK